MRAIVITEPGGTDVLELLDVPDPVPGPEEVVVDIVSTALNRADLLQRRGLYPGPPMEHEIPGLELAGRVSTLGARVSDWSVGDAVMAVVSGGGQAERISVHERQLMAVPDGLALADAGAVPEVFMTAWDALVVQGGLTSGRWALVHAGASGVGTAAIQLVKALGGSVVTTASTGKLEACRSLGADVVVDHTADDFVPAVEAATAGRGVDVVLDVVGGDYLARNLRALATGGTIVQVGVMGGGKAELPLGAMLPKRATIIGTVLRSRPLEEKAALTRRFAREVVPLLGDGRLRPVIHGRWPLAEVAAAHEVMEENRNVGKLVIDVQDTEGS
jgi:putative PIG3 family NAD(P)H quinone oxidoreductase